MRLTNLASWQELFHHGLDVEDRGTVDRVQTQQSQQSTFPFHQPGDRNTKSVRTILSALGKYPNLGPVGFATGTLDSQFNFAFGHMIEVKKNLNVRELFNPIERLRAELGSQFDLGLYRSPPIVA